MSEYANRSKGLGVGADTDVEIERDVVIVESEEAPRVRRSPLAVLPLLLGVIFLLANLLVFSRVPTAFTTKSVVASMSIVLLLVSVALCLALIVYGFAARRGE